MFIRKKDYIRLKEEIDYLERAYSERCKLLDKLISMIKEQEKFKEILFKMIGELNEQANLMRDLTTQELIKGFKEQNGN